MPGFRHSPLADIQRIRQDLRDRYRGGFPILKELLQNADDAGAGNDGACASQCLILLSESGLPDAKHMLLRGPGLCVLNDGDFLPGDANSITSLGLSNKATQSGSAGKFGLGLKSVFHWAEALFYFSPHTFSGDPAKQSPASDLMNPWWSRYAEDGLHAEWDVEWKETAVADIQAFSALAHLCVQNPRWFGLWIPFRRAAHLAGVEPIEKTEPKADLNDLFGEGWAQRLGCTLPLLRRVSVVRVGELRAGSPVITCVASIAEIDGRMLFGTCDLKDLKAGRRPLSGKASIAEGSQPATPLAFTGHEHLPETLEPEAWLNHQQWPSQSSIGPTGQTVQEKEKAAIHGATVFIRVPTQGPACLQVQHAVFLPLGQPEQIKCSTEHSYILYLHGFFFVDSGRQHLQDFSDLPANAEFTTVATETDLLRLWNRSLMHDIVAPLVLPSLDAFVRDEQISAKEVEALVSALEDSETLQKLTARMCCGQRFINRLQPTGGQWTLEVSPTQDGDLPHWIVLPAPQFPETELFDFLPALTALCNRASVSLRGKPSLANQDPKRPNDDELADLLQTVAVSAFDEPGQLTYLLALIPEDTRKSAADSSLTLNLVKLATNLLCHPVPDAKSLSGLWRDFFERLPLAALIRLPCPSNKAEPDIARILADANLPVALVWQDLRDAEGQGIVTWESLLPLLTSLGRLPLTTEVAVLQRSNIALRLLEACEAKPTAWAESLVDLPIFHSRLPAGTVRAATITELRNAHGDQRLFASGAPWASDLIKAAPEVKPLLVEKAVSDLLGLAVPDCAAPACVRLLQRAVRLKEDFASRKPLFTRLLTTDPKAAPEVWAALRCLLHGQISQWQQVAPLYREGADHAVLLTVAKRALEAGNQTWRLIPKYVADQLALNAEQEKLLNLANTSASHIQALLQEAGPEKVDCADLSREDCDALLQQFNDAAVLRGLNIHDTLDRRRVRIGNLTYVDDGTFTQLPPAFDDIVIRIQDNPNYARFTCLESAARLVVRLDWEAVIEIALGQLQPTAWATTILTAIGQRGNLRTDLKLRVQETPWLPSGAATAVKPAALLHVPGAETEIHALPDDFLNPRVPLLRLDESVRKHDRFETFKTTILPPAKDALADLAKLLKPQAGWSTGLTGECSADLATNWVRVLGTAPKETLPIAALAQALYSVSSVRELLPAFLQAIASRLTQSAYGEVLKHLAKVHQAATLDQRPQVEHIFLCYLKEIDAAQADFARTVLTRDKVQLLSAAGRWKSPHQLAPPTEGLSTEDTIATHWAKVLPNLIASCGQAKVPKLHASPPHDSETWTGMANQVRRFFEPWRKYLPSAEPIGAFLCLFGSPQPMVTLANEYFHSHSAADVHRWLDQEFPGVRHKLDQQLAESVPHIEIQSDPKLLVRSVVATDFEARRDENPSTLILGGDPCIAVGAAMLVNGAMQPGPKRRVLRLLPVDPARTGLSLPAAISILRGAAEQVIERTTGTKANLEVLFDQLSKASQVEVQVAQSLVVESALGLLRQIGGHAHVGIKSALARWDEARRDEASAESLGVRDQQRRADEKRRAAKQQIRDLLEKDAQAQHALLREVIRKLQQYRYDVASVPFELWQNADDALLELEQLTSDVTAARTAGFLLDEESNSFQVIHFGRLINEFRLPGGASREDLGFNRDLEKMVVQSISDKTEVGNQSGAGLTGKFGLGFKSVFLVSDAPEVLSGSVDFVIRGGIYPLRLDEAQRDELVSALKAAAPKDWRRGTVIRLPFRPDASANGKDPLSLFHRLAPLLVVFSRRLKRLRMRRQGHDEPELRWHPKTLLPSTAEFGELAGLAENLSGALVLSSKTDTKSDKVMFLLGMNANGFTPLPDEVPVFWVTAPTRETPGYGFAVNGPFEPDVGRVQLALNSARNEQVAGELAQVLATQLQALWQKSAADWESFGRDSCLASSVSSYDFWKSLWDVLGDLFASKCPSSDSTTVAKLARRILWNSNAGGLARFYAACAALPAGLWGKYRTLTRLPEVTQFAAGALGREPVFRVVSGWQTFQNRVPVGCICSNEVETVLRRLSVLPPDAASLTLAAVVEWDLGDAEEKLSDAESAARLGQVITPDFMTKLKEGKIEEREETEYKHLSDLLSGVLFQAEDGSWHKSTALLVASDVQGVSKDELLRAAFTPRERRLHQSYTGPALAFFLAARSRFETIVEHMAAWVLNAPDATTQIAALKYLLNGQLKEPLAAELRARRDDTNWLWRLDQQPWFKDTFTADERHQLFAYVLRLFDQELRDRLLPPPPPPPEPITIWTVQQLWDWWQEQGMPTAEYTLEGEPNWLLFHGGPIESEQERQEELKRLLLSPSTPDGKALWYRLFGYACLVSAGRYMTELRRFWLQRLDADQFWTLTSNGDFSERTRDIFERAVTAEFTNMSAGGEQAYFWRRVFYDIRKVHRMVWVNDFPAVLMELVDRGHAEHLPQFLRTGHLPGPDQPRWVGTFGQSAATPLRFLIRELFRLQVITDEKVRPFAFYVCRPVLRALWKIGWIDDEDDGFSGELWLEKLNEDPVCGRNLLPYYDIPLLHMGITYRGGRMPVPPSPRT